MWTSRTERDVTGMRECAATRERAVNDRKGTKAAGTTVAARDANQSDRCDA